VEHLRKLNHPNPHQHHLRPTLESEICDCHASEIFLENMSDVCYVEESGNESEISRDSERRSLIVFQS
jgi:hypothetical protein